MQRSVFGAWVLVLAVAAGAQSAELFVGSGVGDFVDLQAALAAASAGSTITIRGGYSTPGADVSIPNLTIRGEFNHNINANNPSNLYQLNPARGLESVVTGPISLPTLSGANPDGTKILGLFFDIPSVASAVSAVNFVPGGNDGRAVQNVVVSNNRFRATSPDVLSWVGSGGNSNYVPHNWADGILVENNRMGDMFVPATNAILSQGTA